MNQVQLEKRTMQYFRWLKYLTYFFNMACAGARECDHTPFPFRSAISMQISFNRSAQFNKSFEITLISEFHDL